MTATNIVLQPRYRCLQVLTDGAVYDANGVVKAFATKTRPIPNWPGVVTGRGAAMVTTLIASALSQEFQTFDRAVDGIERAFADMLELYAIRGSNEIIIAGWSERRDEPEAYVIYCDEGLPPGMDATKVAEAVSRGGIAPPNACKLRKLPGVVAGPMLGASIRAESGWTGIDQNAEPDAVTQKLVRLMELQRRDIETGVDYVSVGGFAELTTITPSEIRQRIVHRWPDKIGQRIEHMPFALEDL